MTGQQKTLILLIRSALTEQSFSLSEDVNLDTVFFTAKQHGVEVMAYYGAVYCGADRSGDLMSRERLNVYSSAVISERQMSEAAAVMDALEANGVDHMPLKGVLLKGLYPRSEMRKMSDADILIREAQYDGKIRSVMKDLGYTEKYESDHEHAWQRKPVNIELHKHLIPTNNRDYYAYYGDGWQLAVPTDGYAHRFRMRAEDEFLYLFTHFAKHYRDAGIGIRHAVDLWVYRRHCPDLDEAYLRRELEALHLSEFYGNVMNTLGVWFDGAQPNEKTEFITQVIFASGEYGLAVSAGLSTNLRGTQDGATVSGAKRNRIFHTLFPTYTVMCQKFRILKKVPVLLPLFWAVRIVREMFSREKIRRFVRYGLTPDAAAVSEYQRALNFVGLDYYSE